MTSEVAGSWPPWRMVAAVAAGGAAGASLRAVGLAAFPTAEGGFPVATFVENVTGAFLLGALLTLLASRWHTNRYAKPLLGTGLLGAYTTFSTFAIELALLLAGGWWVVALTYAAVTLVVGVAAVFVGVALARRWTGPRGNGGVTTGGETP